MTAVMPLLAGELLAAQGASAFPESSLSVREDAGSNPILPMLPMLSIVIPALNEEESIESTVRRCLEARDHIQRAGGVRDVEIIVVNDGSTDRTQEIAQRVADVESAVSVINFAQNRGYGAALKEGFQQARGELVSFLDADGTCDPRYFAAMCSALHTQGAAVVLGSRMGPGNQMPPIRRLGNTLYALLLGFLSGRAVTDTASGMRVIRRNALPELYPLPDGLHFTPAMSARALLSDLRIVEVPMAYAERVGESKLHVLRDGVRFLVAIMNALLLYRPSRIFGVLSAMCILIALMWGMYPLEFYWRHQRLEEWMIYRVLLCAFLGTCAFTFTGAGVLSEQVLSLVYRRRWRTFFGQWSEKLFSNRILAVFAAAAMIAAASLVWPGLKDYLLTGHTTLHWSRAIVAVYLVQLTVLAGVMMVLRRVVSLWREQIEFASHLGRSSNG
jgi:glycosyltransferase involved in cell wall biosynthesis